MRGPFRYFNRAPGVSDRTEWHYPFASFVFASFVFASFVFASFACA